MNLARRLAVIVGVFISILGIGTLGFHLIEGWPWLDSIYMSVITVTTVGFAEVRPPSTSGQIFTMLLIVLGVGGITYTFTAVTNYIIQGELQGIIEERRMNRTIRALKNHYVVCGYGEMGEEVCLELEREGCEVVVIDHDPSAYKAAKDAGHPAVQGDAGMDENLERAGIDRARGLVAATDDDATNLLVVLSARALNSKLNIVARANNAQSPDKLLRAGADRVLFPYSIAGRRLAQMLIRPEVCDFLDVVAHDESLELLLENFTVDEAAELRGQTVKEAQVRKLTGAHIVGLKKDGRVVSGLDAETTLETGDIIIALGTREQVTKLGKMLGAIQS